MTYLSALFIGGNGIISSACSRLAVAQGFDVTLLNRGRSTTRPPIDGAKTLVADAADPGAMRAAIGDRDFDVVVNFQVFDAQRAAADIELFSGRTGQYVFISTAATYQKPVVRIPITESTPQRNPFSPYAQNKIASETTYIEAYRARGFPVTIVRPSHTYDPTLIPLDGGWTVIDRMRRGRKTVIHGDGTSLWTLTHQEDFARAFTGLLGNPRVVGDSVHITSDEALTWDAIAQDLARAAGADADIVHVASAQLVREIPAWEGPIIGDKSYSLVFDNAKIKRLVPGWTATIPFWRGAREIVAWYDAHPEHQVVDPDLDQTLDRVAAAAG
ncbi:MAG TPA: NAD-dependent epimerase/dehydratase family protein [Streptosporangiaceae bacterium]